MFGFLILVANVSFFAFIFYWWKKRKARKAAGQHYEDDPTYQSVSKTKRIIGIVCIVSYVLGMALAPSGAEKRNEANIAKVAQLDATNKAKYDARFQKYILQFDEIEARDRALADLIEDQRVINNAAKFDAENKAKYEAKFQGYLASMDEMDARSKAYSEVQADIKAAADAKAAEEAKLKAEAEKKAKEEEAQKKAQEAEEQKKLAEAKAAQEAAVKATKDAEAKIPQAQKDLNKLEAAGKIAFDGGRVIITEQADFSNKAFGGDTAGFINMIAHDEHEKNVIRASYQCMKLVQTVKDAGVKADYFVINLTGTVEDYEGYRSQGNVVTCEIRGNASYERDDPYSFHNSSERFWTINGL